MQCAYRYCRFSPSIPTVQRGEALVFAEMSGTKVIRNPDSANSNREDGSSPRLLMPGWL